MVYFDCDYMTGAHPAVLKALTAANNTPTPGYGNDPYCASARRKILEACAIPDGDVFFLVGGTQTNTTVIDWLIRRGQSVVCADTGHINVHEAGAVESSGHKVVTIPGHDGKILASELDAFMANFYADDTWTHYSRPAMVYISFPTELGTLYTKAELEEIAAVCRKYDMPLFIDGARLAYGLAASEDVTLADIARIADIFYIGGTKCGTLMGEAVVARDAALLKNFLTHAKSHGALLAKGRLLGIQFDALMTDDLYLNIGREAVRLAMRLKNEFTRRGYPLLIDSPTNQQFFVLPNDVLDRLRTNVSFELWGPRGATHTPVRFVTSWSTTDADIDAVFS
ncbi:MAG: aminotransferase class I/II-fold pyridoxal phosphate-dependent enzyme [Muribaculaceae bacterium]|nr:aminotransferase class I/II-fold pyridoxal phosphate-dependent enzyme [Muribaculaceae bacterium]